MRRKRLKYPNPPYTRVRVELCHTDWEGQVRVLGSIFFAFLNSEFTFQEVTNILAKELGQDVPLRTEVVLRRAEETYQRYLERWDRKVLEKINRHLAREASMGTDEVVSNREPPRLVDLPTLHPGGTPVRASRPRSRSLEKSKRPGAKDNQICSGETGNIIRPDKVRKVITKRGKECLRRK